MSIFSSARFTGPGILRLYLAIFVAMQHLKLMGEGSLAVYLFFVMSGYWIAALWKKKYAWCQQPYITFMVSRWWRIAPLYYFCTAMMGALYFHYSPGPSQTFMQHDFSALWLTKALLIVGCGTQATFLPPTWSLDIELQFYLVAPLLIGFMEHFFNRKARIQRAFPLLLIGVSVSHFFLPTRFCIPLGSARFLAFFVAGIWIYYSQWKSSRPWALAGLMCVLAVSCILYSNPLTRVMICPGAFNNDKAVYLGHTLYTLLTATLLIPAVAFCLGHTSDSLDRSLGNFAYPLYLFHEFPIELIDRMAAFKNLAPLGYLLTAVFAISLGTLCLFFFVDRPLERLRQQFVNGRLRKPQKPPLIAVGSHDSCSRTQKRGATSELAN